MIEELIVSKGAIEPSHYRNYTYFYSSGRAGFRDLLVNDTRSESGPKGVLLPAYIGWSPKEGSGVFDPVRESGRPYEFYDLLEDLSVNVSSLNGLLSTGKYSHIVLIHYFGRLDPHRQEVYRMAKHYGVVVVDDLAHGFFTSQIADASLGGDARIYSLHKQFPLPDGGMVTYINGSLVGGQRNEATNFPNLMLQYDWLQIARCRRDNYTQLARLLAPNAGNGYRMLWPSQRLDWVPQSLPVLVDSRIRDQLYFSMNDSGYGVTSLYHTLIEESRGKSKTADFISASILNLPVHQDVESEGLDDLVTAFTRHLAMEGEFS